MANEVVDLLADVKNHRDGHDESKDEEEGQDEPLDDI